MRLSAEKSDPGYGEYVRFRVERGNPKVFLDGCEQKHCVTADDEAGMIVRYAIGPDGRFVIVGDELIMETVHGKVVIEAE